MLTSSNGNIFRVIRLLCGEVTAHRWIPCTKANDAEFDVFFDLSRISSWVNNCEAGDLIRHQSHYDVIVMYYQIFVDSQDSSYCPRDCFNGVIYTYDKKQQSMTRAVCIIHDDVIKWQHFPRNWPFVRGIHRSPVNSLHKGQWRGALMFSLICVWINDWVNNREAGDLRRYRAHYDVIVMYWNEVF